MLTVELASERNPDIRGNGGYWSPGRRPTANRISVASIAEAVRVCGCCPAKGWRKPFRKVRSGGHFVRTSRDVRRGEGR